MFDTGHELALCSVAASMASSGAIVRPSIVRSMRILIDTRLQPIGDLLSARYYPPAWIARARLMPKYKSLSDDDLLLRRSECAQPDEDCLSRCTLQCAHLQAFREASDLSADRFRWGPAVRSEEVPVTLMNRCNHGSGRLRRANAITTTPTMTTRAPR